MNFEALAILFQQTHTELQKRVSRSVDIALVVRNWLFGWYIVEYEQDGTTRAELYGKKLLERLSKELKLAGIKGVSLTNLKQFRLFYETYREIGQVVPDQSPADLSRSEKITHALLTQSFRGSEIWKEIQRAVLEKSTTTYRVEPMPPVLHEVVQKLTEQFVLGWTHYVVLLTVKNCDERRFYEIESIQNCWGYRELERQINSGLYERLALSRDKEAVKRLSLEGLVVEKPSDLIKNPYILEFTGLEEKPSYSEYDLETAIINRLEQFLLELGKGFLFEARQKRFTFDHNHFYVDLVFYNRLLRCYVLIDLKIGEIKHQDLGQMQMYVNYFDRYVKTEGELPSIGILLCHTKSDDLVELTLPKDSNIFASQYELYLPSKEELKNQLISILEEINV